MMTLCNGLKLSKEALEEHAAVCTPRGWRTLCPLHLWSRRDGHRNELHSALPRKYRVLSERSVPEWCVFV